MKRSSVPPDPHWTIESLLDSHPEAAAVLLRNGMACVGCAKAPFETLVEAAREYRLDLASFLKELQMVANDPKRRGTPSTRSVRHQHRRGQSE